ncbi:MAG: AI-2E family transporter [Nitrospirae bacterium]|nr:AI-2E family transporter [Nitrospirota bacterium]
MKISRKRIALIIFVAIVVLILYGAHEVFKPFYESIIWAAIAGVTFWPVNKKIRYWLGGRGSLSSLIAVVGVLLFFLVPSAFLLMSLVTQITNVYEKIYPQMPLILNRLSHLIPFHDDSLRQKLIASVDDVGKVLVSYAGSVGGNALSVIFQMAFTVMILYFIFRDGESFIEKLRNSALIPAEDIDVFVRETGGVISAVIYGVIFTAMLQGVLGGFGFWITGLPAPVLFGAVMFILAIIPFAGTALVWGPAAIYLIYYGMIGKGVFLIIWGLLAVGMIDNILRPYFISKRLGFHVVLSFIGIVGGMSAFGLLGVFLGPLLLALMLRLFEKYSGMEA